MKKAARDKGAQEESRRAHGAGRKKETQGEVGPKEEEEGWEWKRKRGTRVLTAQEESRRAHGVGRKKERQDEGGAEEEKEG